MKLTYEELMQSKEHWKRICYSLTDQIRAIADKQAHEDKLVKEIANVSAWNAKHIEENDKLKLEIAELEQALTGRTVSCDFCNQTAKERDEMRSAVRKFVLEEGKFAAKSFVSTIISYGDERPRAWRAALRAMERML